MLWSRWGQAGMAVYVIFFLALLAQLNPWARDVESTEKVRRFVYPSAAQRRLPDTFRLTVFTAPKACTAEHTFMIQSNALRSWAVLRPAPTIIVFGNETGSEVLARQVGALHVPDCAKSPESGAPLLRDLFRRARTLSDTELYIFANADIILPQMTMVALASAFHYFPRFLLVAHRFRMHVHRWIDFDAEGEWQLKLLDTCANTTLQGKDGLRDGESCIVDWANAIDLFAFTADFLQIPVPDFIVGRPVFDNWLLSYAIRTGWPAIDATNVLTIIHQNHNYSHLGTESKPNYWSGEEGESNRKLGLKHGGWSRGTILHTQWQFTPGCNAQEIGVRTRASRRKAKQATLQGSTYFNGYGGPDDLVPAHLCPISLRRSWALRLLFFGALLSGTMCLVLAWSHTRVAGKSRPPTPPSQSRGRRAP